jgi:vacuolar-type H+-ATPase subunit I/STV1
MSFFILIWSISTIAFFALASGMEKHQKQIFLKTLTPKMTLFFGILGWLLLIIGLILCLYKGHISNMISYWVGVLTFAALAVGLTLSYKAEYSRKIAIILSVLAIISAGLYYL